jgi:hypothetical protein
VSAKKRQSSRTDRELKEVGQRLRFMLLRIERLTVLEENIHSQERQESASKESGSMAHPTTTASRSESA